ncbi:NADP-dependent oxidoreductase [Paucilactobacillus wasatchensis]|uniref:Oxidoreductase n=1 Tax=Paucilactobacillus wasatchensis TaxID=1335616 RepID=A0A0D1A9H6_9LACO|nr:NADP-dependent oxidoreductase [Paucilactobacillus wasatchensis]KIS03401.1 oxidoreductase [Paucilactobacillus wasatchensis]
MKAFGYQKFGDPAVFEEIELPEPRITKADQVIVATLAVGLNNFERSQRAGDFGGDKFPLVPGRDVVGRVTEVGEEVTEVAVGDIVIGHSGPAYATKVKLTDAKLVKKPTGISNQLATTIITPGITAYNAVTYFTHVKAGDTVLVNGATGGVGSIAVQVAQKLGAHVIGTGSSRNKTILEQLKLDEIGLYDQENINEKFAGQADIVINAAMNGKNESLIADVIKDDGAAASVGAAVNLDAKPNVTFKHIRPVAGNDRQALSALAAMLADGSLQVDIFKELPFTLAGVIEGHQLLEKGHAPGRIVLVK